MAEKVKPADTEPVARPVEDVELPEPTYGNQPPVAEVGQPEAPPPAGVKFAEDGQAIVTAAEFRAAVEKEYGTWVAREDIVIEGVPAFRVGDPVPKSHVETGVVDKSSVVGRDTKTAASLTEN